ncbi:MAG: hypothetical protein ABJC12_05825 [Saprospiraceae bacterium]
MDLPDIQKEFNYRLENILISNFRIGYPLEVIMEHDLGLEYGYDFKFDFETDMTNCLIHIRYILHHNEQEISKQKILVHCDINFFYKVINLKSFVKEVNNNYVLDLGVLGQLLNITFGTSRGIIYEKTRGYPVNEFILPITALKSLIKNTAFPISGPLPNVSEPPSP